MDVSGLRSSDGVVHLLVYDDATAFNEGAVVDIAGIATREASADGLRLEVQGLRPGHYALLVHHDENANDLFETRGNLPLEGWGYSNNVGQLEIPSFAAAAVTLDDKASAFEITVFYAN